MVPMKNRHMFSKAASQLVFLALNKDLTNDLKHGILLLDLAECVKWVPVYYINKRQLFPSNRNDVSCALLYMMYRERNRCRICLRAPISPIQDNAKDIVAPYPNVNHI